MQISRPPRIYDKPKAKKFSDLHKTIPVPVPDREWFIACEVLENLGWEVNEDELSLYLWPDGRWHESVRDHLGAVEFPGYFTEEAAKKMIQELEADEHH